jgi:hypothetical protein
LSFRMPGTIFKVITAALYVQDRSGKFTGNYSKNTAEADRSCTICDRILRNLKNLFGIYTVSPEGRRPKRVWSFLR